MIPDDWRTVYLLNPMAGTLLAFRGTFFDPFPFPWLPWLYSLGWSLGVLVLGVWLFRRTEIQFADKL
jgi:lipopolysaccharide transport system permease protein